MSKHTPGPWEVLGFSNRFVVDSKGRHVVVSMLMEDAATANATLCAAAPDMLAALEHVIHVIEKSGIWWMDNPSQGGFDAEMIRAAIAKATGGES